MNDFFSGAPVRPPSEHDEAKDNFAKAIAGRFSNSDKRLLSARLTPALEVSPSTSFARSHSTTHVSLSRPRTPAAASTSTTSIAPATPFSNMSLSTPLPMAHRVNSTPGPSTPSSSSESFTTATASSLPHILRTPRVLILDIRPHSAYAAARLPHALSLSVPSTLLKRPAFALQKLSTMLSSPSAQARFMTWRTASRILVYDAESSALHEGSSLLGLLRKFRAEGFAGDIAWLQGGLQALWREHRHLVDVGPPSDDEDELEEHRFIRARDIPLAAFQRSSTNTVLSRSSMKGSPPFPLCLQMLLHTSSVVLPTQGASPAGPQDNGTSLSAANPFYDNIRQNVELSQGITERIPLQLSPTVATRAKDLPFSWLRDIAGTAGQEVSTEALAMQFYRIELREQRRLQGVMTYHTQQGTSAITDTTGREDVERAGKEEPAVFPYSILAGVEKGEKNRYRNIWPFEHARVRLKGDGVDDYVNASFVQPLGTKRRYIATQGPLPSTYTDFWTLVWEQDVRVIVMLTRQFEGSNVKCGKYWLTGEYGPLQLKQTSVSGAREEFSAGANAMGGAATGGFDFSFAAGNANELSSSEDEDNNTTRRTFELVHTGYPDLPPRRIVQFQYLAWTDMDVPKRPRGLLRLIREVDAAVDSANEEVGFICPSLMHCSAGVGRTGAFIMIDAILDGIRRELRKLAAAEAAKTTTAGSVRFASNDGDDSMAAEMDLDNNSRARRVSGPTSPHVSGKAHKQVTLVSPKATDFVQTQAGLLATLHTGGRSLHHKGPDIHVPVVPASSSPTKAMAPSQPPISGVRGQSQAVPSSPLSPNARPGAARPQNVPPLALSAQTQATLRRRGNIPEFTVADADSMFTSRSLNPDFAMDVEQLQQLPPQQGGIRSGSRSGTGSSSGEGSVKHLAKQSSVFPGYIAPIAAALARMSSSDDPGPMERSDSDSNYNRFNLRARTASGSGSGSISGDVSGGSGSLGGGYSSSSSFAFPFPPPLRLPPNLAPPAFHNTTSTTAATQQTTRPSLSRAGSAVHQGEPPPPPANAEDILAARPFSFTSSASIPSPLRNGAKGRPSKHAYRSESSVPSTDTLPSVLSTTPAESSDTPPSAAGASRSLTPEKLVKEASPDASDEAQGPVFDYTMPRPLHQDDSPPLLSSLEEPVREILEDMREQRMSLCQSLRQYVFVHCAIVEGALQIMDEEKARTGAEAPGKDDDAAEEEDTQSEESSDPSMVSAEVSVHATGKRGASPTELPKEGKKGEPMLNKRPSIKRGKSTSSGDSGGSSPTNVD